MLISKLLTIRLVLLASLGAVEAQTPQLDGVTRKQLLQQSLPLPTVASVLMNEITLAPGKGTPDHHHPSEVYSYVLEGEIRCQAYGQSARILHVGDCFREAAGQRIQAFNNNSLSKPCRFVAFYLLKKDQPFIVLTTATPAR